MSLMAEMGAKAQKLGVPISVHMDLTYLCNERCIHCYLDHDDHGEMTTSEIKGLIGQLAEAGVFFLTFSGGEIFLRKDLFELVEYARGLMFSVKLKTNAVMIRERDARRIAKLGVEAVQISIYSHRPEVHDGITKVPGSLKRSIEGARLLRQEGVKVMFADVLMRNNFSDHSGVRALAQEMGAHFTVDPTITPMLDGDRSVLALNIGEDELRAAMRNPDLVGDVNEFCAPPAGPMDAEEAGDMLPCSAGHTSCYVSPYGDVYPCVAFPLPTGNVRTQRFLDIWNDSPEMNDVRSITVSDLPTCSTCSHGKSCTRCPGLAYLEGNMRGPSSQDCEKSFARTGVVTSGMLARLTVGAAAPAGLVQIQGVR
jgi:AdoMet-dependent heme synthase